MTVPREDKHSKFVADWFNKNAIDLTLDQQMLILCKAIKTIEKRSRTTLSNITLMVILDRVLTQSKENFPILADVKLDTSAVTSINFTDYENLEKSKDLIKALEYLLIDLLSVLSRITADILTQPLHEELLKVTGNPETL